MRINSDIQTSTTGTDKNKNPIKKIDLNGKDPFDLGLIIEAKRIQPIFPDPTNYCGTNDNCTGCGCNTCCSSC